MASKDLKEFRDSFAGSRLPPGDYVAEGLAVVLPDELFPYLVVGDKANHPWPYLRREVSHNWYCDQRYPQVGFLNRDEVLLLYNLALQFSGKPGLEIGCWMGWSTCHLALAGLHLDVIDPVLANREHEASVRYALEGAHVIDRVRFFRTGSPRGVELLAQLKGEKWNFFFIDGDHEAPAPEQDARTCLRYAAADAMFVFHDLVSPDVEKGLAVLSEAGFKTMIYETMQIVGIAWRGNVKPVCHIPDPANQWSIPRHLLRYQFAGEDAGIRAERLAGLLEISEQELALREARIAEIAASALTAQKELALRDSQITELTCKVDELYKLAETRFDTISQMRVEIAERERSVLSLENAVNRAQTALRDTVAALQESTRRTESTHRQVEELSASLAHAQSTIEGLRLRILGIKASFSWSITAPLREIRRTGVKIIRYSGKLRRALGLRSSTASERRL